MNHDVKIKAAEQFLKDKKEDVAKNHWRLDYHVAPPAGWMNDPNGFSYHNGEYHLFYQHHPYSPVWGPMYWGHVKSKDLAVWEQLPIALAPSEEYDADGCFSGSAISKDGKLYVMYTGNVWTGEDWDHDLKQVQCLAYSEDGVGFEKLDGNPVISLAPEGDVHPFHFRDPKVWKKGDLYYCVLGSKTKANIGQILLYRSKDLMDWEFVSVAAKGEGNFGYMWECPDIFELDGADVLMMSPQGMKPEGHLYQNLHQSGYVVGKLDYETGNLEHGPFQVIDYGFDVYAPQTTLDEQGRRIVIAWMNMWESEMPEKEYGWAGAMTLPRVLTMEDGKIICRPVPELEKLRGEGLSFYNVRVDGEVELTGVSGNCLELQMTMDAKNASRFGLKLAVDPELGEETVLAYESKEGFFSFNRDRSGAGPKGVRHATVELKDNKLELKVFLDSSSVEVFINDGEKVMTGRIYPGKDSKRIQFFSEGEMEIVELVIWELESAFKGSERTLTE